MQRLVKKAQQSKCNNKVSAVALDKKGMVLGYSRNTHRFSKKGGGIHAEIALILQYKRHIKTIIICRANNSGDLLPIDPCPCCKSVADKLGIKILSVSKVL